MIDRSTTPIHPPAPFPGSRELFALDPAVAHLNHGSYGAVPHVVRAARQRLLDEFDANPMRFMLELPAQVSAARDQLARFLGAEPAHSSLVANATTGTAIALRTLQLRPGDEVVFTDHGYQPVSVALSMLRDQEGVTTALARIPLGASPHVALTSITSRLSERTKLVIVDAVSADTAQRHPVEELAVQLRAEGIALLVDAAHAPGMLPSPARISADFWVGNLHKWAFAPAGTALLQVSPEWHDRIQPLVISHSAMAGYPGAVEWQATRDYSPWLAAPVGLETFTRFGAERVREHNVTLAAYGQRVIGSALDLDPAQLPNPGAEVSMRIIPLPEGVATTTEAAQQLRTRISTQLATEVAVNSWQGRGLLRISGQIYNRAAEYDRLAEGLPAILNRQ